MNLLDISIQSRVIIGISAMVLLFSSFLIAFITSQRKKLQYHKNLEAINEQQRLALVQENMKLEDRVKERTVELSKQKENLQNALTDLKASQLQLVQKEKMASLGEVASGIAHEIQNPLNFINNFAEINAELLVEIKDILSKPNLASMERGEIGTLADDVIQNLSKIRQHGSRADNIVKNLLQHARGKSGDAELTDVNFIADEYLKLSYHGFRARDPLFSVKIKTNFDPSVEKINLVPQEIGRVLMNLYNNSFYSVKEKHDKFGAAYEPAITISTKMEDGKVKIITRDNGGGIPQRYLGKIFQPFFTTKPTGTGTGLGLSLSYDIIKANQGEIKVESKEGEFAEFTIELLVG